MADVIPPMNLPPEATPWGRAIQKELEETRANLDRLSSTSDNNAAMATSSNQVTTQNVQTLTALTGNLQQQVAGLAGAAINTTTVTASGAVTAGSLSVSGSAAITGNVSASNVTGSNVFAQSLATVITAGRVALWGRLSDGYIATASSSERFKTGITPVDISSKAPAILKVAVSYFEYIDEVRKRDDPTADGYVGPSYHVGRNLGGIAEQLHSLGLWEWVIYERDELDNLKLNPQGEPIPFGIHDILMGWAALIVAQSLDKRISAIETKLGL